MRIYKRIWLSAVGLSVCLPLFAAGEFTQETVSGNIETIFQRQIPSNRGGSAGWKLVLPEPEISPLDLENMWRDHQGFVRYNPPPAVAPDRLVNVYLNNQRFVFDGMQSRGTMKLVVLEHPRLEGGKRLLADGTQIFRRVEMRVRADGQGALRMSLGEKTLKTAGSMLVHPQDQGVGARVLDSRMVLRRSYGVINFTAPHVEPPVSPAIVSQTLRASDRLIEFFASNPRRTLASTLYRGFGPTASSQPVTQAARTFLTIDLERVLGSELAPLIRTCLMRLAK